MSFRQALLASGASALTVKKAGTVRIVPRDTPTKPNMQIEAALDEYAGAESPNADPALIERLDTINDDDAVSKKYAGDTWKATFALLALTAGQERYGAMNALAESDVRNRLYQVVLKRKGQHRMQRIAAYIEMRRLESLDHSGE